MQPRTQQRRDPSTGITIMEILIVLAIVGLLVAAIGTGANRLRHTELRDESGRLVAILRSTFDRAASSGVHHRVVFDLEAQAYRMERCEQGVRLWRGMADDDAPDPGAEVRKRLQDAVAAGSIDPGVLAAIGQGGAASDIAGLGEGAPGGEVDPDSLAGQAASCVRAEGEKGRIHKLKGGRVQFTAVALRRQEEPFEEGMVAINFFPMGYAEKAAIEIQDASDKSMTVLVYPLTGQVRLESGKISDWRSFMEQDGEGEDQEREE